MLPELCICLLPPTTATSARVCRSALRRAGTQYIFAGISSSGIWELSFNGV